MANEFEISTAVPWGRNATEYLRMFSLSESDVRRRILDCGGGPASFNTELTAGGGNVVSVDPLYSYSAVEIEDRVRETYPKIMNGVQRAHERFVWTEIGSPERLGEIRLAAMHAFLNDFEQGKAAGRYVVGRLPVLPFPNDSFELAVVSHLLFLYSEQMDVKFHVSSLCELLRIAPEVRVFPLLDMHGNSSAHLDSTVAALSKLGFACELQRVNYEFQLGGHTMLRIGRN